MLLPVALNLFNRRVLVVGGGKVAARKARACLEVGALVTAISPVFGPDFPDCEKIVRRFESGDCNGFFLVFAATDSREVNAQIAGEAAFCNLADDPENSDFHTASVLRRGEIAIGVTTGAASPVLAAFVKNRLDSALPSGLETLLGWVRSYGINLQIRGDAWREILQSEILDLLENGQTNVARERLDTLLSNHTEPKSK